MADKAIIVWQLHDQPGQREASIQFDEDNSVVLVVRQPPASRLPCNALGHAVTLGECELYLKEDGFNFRYVEDVTAYIELLTKARDMMEEWNADLHGLRH